MAASLIWESIPSELKSLSRWVLWKIDQRDGRPTKVPIRADSGLPAESDNQTTWTSFENAREAFEKGRGGAVGIGFVFARASGISGIDLDHCRDPATGQIDTWAMDILRRLNSYSEISPSGSGLHVFVRGTIPVTGADGGKRKTLKDDGYRPDAAVEVYSNKRFFTMTGNILPGYPQTMVDRQDALMTIYTEVFGPVETDTAHAHSKAQDEAQGEPVDKPRTAAKPGLSDEAVIARMLGSSNANEIEALLKGDKSAYNEDDSSADIALCNHLAFWTTKDKQQMDRIFRTSKLMRPKWDEKRGRQTYGEMTINDACSQTKDAYQPSEEEIIATVEEIALPENVRRWDNKLLSVNLPGVDKDGVTYGGKEVTNKKGNKVHLKTRICDGFAYISEETRDDKNEASFTVEGRGSKDGHEFRFDISGRDFSDPRKLKAALVAHFGARNQIRKMDADVIQNLTKDVKKLTLITAPCWINDKLAIPGIDENGFKFRLSSRVPADLSTGEDKRGLEALALMFKTWPADRCSVPIAVSLASPVCGRWFRGDRFGLALVGTTGRGLKTEMLKALLAIYGAGFLSEETLLRWGDGATTNAMLNIATSCGCLPSGVDNYKNTQRDGANKFVSFSHTVLEGRERERLNRNAELRETREYACTLLITGEDLPEEASTVARVLPWEWSTPPDTAKLTDLQKIAHHLPAAGRVWCRYLSDTAQVDMDAWRESRAQLVKAAKEAGAINPGRIGTTASILRLVWTMALDSPLGAVLRDYSTDFEKGLSDLILSTSAATCEMTEAAQFIEILRELITSGRYIVLDRVRTGSELTLPNVVGWRLDEEGSTAIFPDLAIEAVRRVTGPQAQIVGKNTLYRQLDEAGLIEPGTDNRTQNKRAGSKQVRVLVFKAGSLQDEGILDHVDLTKSSEMAAEDIERRKAADAIVNQVKQAVKIG